MGLRTRLQKHVTFNVFYKVLQLLFGSFYLVLFCFNDKFMHLMVHQTSLIEVTIASVNSADDTSISYSSKNIDELNETLNSDLDSLKQWLEGNKLSLNVIETQAMVIGSMPNIKKISDKSVPTPSFAIGNSHIDVVDNAKYLGVQLDKHLVWG